jgi:hypothetical protein
VPNPAKKPSSPRRVTPNSALILSSDAAA